MKIIFAHLCDYAMVSKEGKLSLIGLISRISVPTLPARVAQIFIAFEVEVNYAEMNRPADLRLEIVDADGGRLQQIQAQFKIDGPSKPGQNPKIGQIVQVNGLQLNRYGAHNVNIFLGNHLGSQIAFDVSKLQAPPSGMPKNNPLPPAQ